MSKKPAKTFARSVVNITLSQPFGAGNIFPARLHIEIFHESLGFFHISQSQIKSVRFLSLHSAGYGNSAAPLLSRAFFADQNKLFSNSLTPHIFSNRKSCHCSDPSILVKSWFRIKTQNTKDFTLSFGNKDKSRWQCPKLF